MEQGSWVEYHPITTVTDGSPVEFDISGTGDDYIDFGNTKLFVKIKVVRLNGNNMQLTQLLVLSIFFYTVCSRRWTFRLTVL